MEDPGIGRSLLALLGIVIVLLLCSLTGWTLHAAGAFGDVFVERKVFEHSYQRSEAIKSQVAGEEANIAELDRKLANPGLDEDTRFNLEAQRDAARLRLHKAQAK